LVGCSDFQIGALGRMMKVAKPRQLDNSECRSAERLAIARKLYQLLAAHDPNRVIVLRDGTGKVVARHDPRPEPQEIAS
jgi:hypothetical protein